MIVHRVVMPVTDAVSWTVLDDTGEPVAPVESYLSHLAALERSPETVRAYAFGLKAYFEFLAAHDVAWDQASVEDVGRFVAWLRAPASNVVVLEGHDVTSETREMFRADLPEFNPELVEAEIRRQYQPRTGAAEGVAA